MKMQVANQILAQLGGNRFLTMTGSKNLVGGERYLQMKLARNSSKANLLRITLDANDTYTVEFSRFRNLDVFPVHALAGVYADQLAEIFTRTTGLDTRL
jgi:hypothetical protein